MAPNKRPTWPGLAFEPTINPLLVHARKARNGGLAFLHRGYGLLRFGL
jgi:hypothetical protein